MGFELKQRMQVIVVSDSQAEALETILCKDADLGGALAKTLLTVIKRWKLSWSNPSKRLNQGSQTIYYLDDEETAATSVFQNMGLRAYFSYTRDLCRQNIYLHHIEFRNIDQYLESKMNLALAGVGVTHGQTDSQTA